MTFELYRDTVRAQVIATFHTLRQQAEKRSGQFQSGARLISSRHVRAGAWITLGAFAVTAGIGLEEVCAHFERDHDDYPFDHG
jgi:5-methyltetrahydrofolate--homocysteine methyltransferase